MVSYRNPVKQDNQLYMRHHTTVNPKQCPHHIHISWDVLNILQICIYIRNTTTSPITFSNQGQPAGVKSYSSLMINEANHWYVWLTTHFGKPRQQRQTHNHTWELRIATGIQRVTTIFSYDSTQIMNTKILDCIAKSDSITIPVLRNFAPHGAKYSGGCFSI